MSQGHFEVRYHSGTINANKILYWVQLNQALMNLADNPNIDFAYVARELEDIRYMQNLTLRRFYMYKLLNLPKDSIEYWESRANLFTDEKTELNPISARVGNSQDL